MVEHQFPKLKAAGSIPVFRSIPFLRITSHQSVCSHCMQPRILKLVQINNVDAKRHQRR